MSMLSRLFALTALTKIGYAFNLYPPVDPNKLATAYNISLDCLNALYVVAIRLRKLPKSVVMLS
jgi:hypothetical protein